MKKSVIAGAAMVAAAAVTVPVVGWSQSSPPPAAPAGAPGPGGPGGEHMGDRMGGPGHDGMHHGWGHWANKSPQQACVDRLARRAGFIASIGFRLNLQDNQKDAWNKVVSATQSGEDAQRKLCDALPANAQDRDKLTALDRLHHREQVLQAKLQAMQQVDPAVQALYDKLTPAQKEILDHPFKRG
ncbi:MAG TPA: Spy/CpxP family protein refolding chaperone [Stellaceae bacterium]|nr:Spy/CpxP family protein refolding chaperone [Stellaceae bacterium]